MLEFGTPSAEQRAALEKEFESASEEITRKIGESLPRIIAAEVDGTELLVKIVNIHKADDGLPILKAYGIDLVNPNK